MHLASEAVTLECAALGYAVAASGTVYSLWRLGSPQAEPAESTAHRAAKAVALGALVFGAQMLNVPVLASSSVHFVGGVLLAELLGPALGVVTMSAVLVLQAVLLGDGGLLALGTNVTNMALLPAGSLLLARRLMSNRSLAVTAAATLSIALAVALVSVEIALGRSSAELAQWSSFVSAMLTNHLPLLPLEGALTLVIAALWQQEKVRQRSTWRAPAMAATAAIVLGLMATAVSSTLPDGYESAAAAAEMSWLLGH